ncbi:MAG: DUF362 domain-containing protein [Candidatus Brocadia sp. AMX2]|nr:MULTISPECIES: DUF362 domain-containing protein [Brocadia]MBC6933716.1 DUF362 domain-containing protein [Candidatus Brocadia sp.]MBL1168744.1 DUF362 domain-containing protein [Candidatus Brocadia sp. AMX1]NOG42803.1 DUF362 domain-containing protein [Planctomycetota bacterium]KAA0242982.1 MAG: DUF362 domain-containing protein [Candidatus Brocadia sp. AMX2]MCE7868087.1 DUF362 domain-containing protein [Candidatus Brocadia sp. AMX2]
MKINKERRLFLKKALQMGSGIYASSIIGKCLTNTSLITWGGDISTVNPATVVIARDDNLFTETGNLKESFVSGLLHKAVMQLTNALSQEKAWQSLFQPNDIVGIKLNCLSGKTMSPHVAVVESIIQGLKLAGVKEKNIIVFERFNRELETAGFRVRRMTDGIQCFGTDELPGGGYEAEPQLSGSVGTCFSKIISRLCTAIINVPVLKDHDLAGISVAMKNFFGVIHNPNKYHGNNCNPFIAELNTHPYIADKVRLIVCDAILAQYHGGPGYKPQWTWNYNGIIVGRDPVALDRICHTIIEEKRKEMKLPSLKQANREPKYISTAAALGLGIDEPSKINVIHA